MPEPSVTLAAIKIFLDVLNGGTVADDSEILKELKNKEWGDGAKTPPDTSAPTVNDVEINQSVTTNYIFRQEKTIYSVENTFNFTDTGEGVNVPTQPSSRLKIEDTEENLGQSETQIKIGSPITLQKAIEQQNFGALLWNPVQNTKQKIRQITDLNFQGKAQEFDDKGLRRYEKFLTNYPEENDKPSIFDSMALILTTAIQGLSGKQGVVFGSDLIRLICSFYSFQSNNAFIGVSDTIPLGYEVSFTTPTYNHSVNEVEGLEVKDFDNGLIDLIGQIPENPANWEQWIEEGITKTVDRSGKNLVLNSPKDIVELIQFISAQFFHRLGLEDYPYTVPENLNLELQEGEEEKTVDLQHLTDFLEWQLKAFDGVLGEFPFKIQIEDNDLIQTGDQPLELSFPNLAETLAEFTGKILQQEAKTEALINISLRLLAESGAIKQQAIQNYYLGTANQEYLGYKTSQEIKDVEFLFNPEIIAEAEENQTLSKALEPKVLPIKIESNIDENSLEGQLATLIEVARIMRAQNWRSFDNKGDIAGQFVSLIKGASELANGVGLNNTEKLEEFLDSVEKGFSDKSLAIDPIKPYGRELDRRPKTKNLKKDE